MSDYLLFFGLIAMALFMVKALANTLYCIELLTGVSKGRLALESQINNQISVHDTSFKHQNAINKADYSLSFVEQLLVQTSALQGLAPQIGFMFTVGGVGLVMHQSATGIDFKSISICLISTFVGVVLSVWQLILEYYIDKACARYEWFKNESKTRPRY